MPKSVFVVGIGGTGMRCIESFVHLCAIGMFDDTEVHLLAMTQTRTMATSEGWLIWLTIIEKSMATQ